MKGWRRVKEKDEEGEGLEKVCEGVGRSERAR